MQKRLFSSILFIFILSLPMLVNTITLLDDSDSGYVMALDIEEEEERGGESEEECDFSQDGKEFTFSNQLMFKESKTTLDLIIRSCFLRSQFQFEIHTPPPELS